MKKITVWILVFCIVLALLPGLGAKASAVTVQQEVIYLEDGSRIIVTVEELGTRASNTKTGSKSYMYQNASGDNLWKATVTGTFTYTGISATCTAASSSVTIYNDAWYTVSKAAWRSINSAVGEFTMGHKILGVTIEEVDHTLKLTCDKNGNLS